jgi:hypothetical protein
MTMITGGGGGGGGCDHDDVTHDSYYDKPAQQILLAENICLSSTHRIRDIISCDRQRLNDTSMAVVESFVNLYPNRI